YIHSVPHTIPSSIFSKSQGHTQFSKVHPKNTT
ncbi:MAG: hypothetical protein ACI90V_008751, partial [Bacillariaceae sp.]